MSDFLNLLFERALLHEHQVVSGLTYQVPSGESLEERAASTIALMETGAERIYQGVLLYPGDSGMPDLLERVDGAASRFGSYFYKPVDVKSGSSYENEEKGELSSGLRAPTVYYATLSKGSSVLFHPKAKS